MNLKSVRLYACDFQLSTFSFEFFHSLALQDYFTRIFQSWVGTFKADIWMHHGQHVALLHLKLIKWGSNYNIQQSQFSVMRCINQSRLEIVLFKQLPDMPHPFVPLHSRKSQKSREPFIHSFRATTSRESGGKSCQIAVQYNNALICIAAGAKGRNQKPECKKDNRCMHSWGKG